VDVNGSSITIHREEEGGYAVVECPLPAVVSVVKGINEPRYPSLKGIMGAKQKPVETKSAGDVGVDAAAVGLEGSGTEVLAAEPRPPKEKGTVVTDQGGDAAAKLADFLQEKKFI
jgi:electron transfer flavoprotein beta subunit